MKGKKLSILLTVVGALVSAVGWFIDQKTMELDVRDQIKDELKKQKENEEESE